MTINALCVTGPLINWFPWIKEMMHRSVLNVKEKLTRKLLIHLQQRNLLVLRNQVVSKGDAVQGANTSKSEQVSGSKTENLLFFMHISLKK